MILPAISSKLKFIVLVTGLLLVGLSPNMHAQSLLSMVESARTYDADYLSDVAATQATRASAKQGRAGVFPKVTLSAEKTNNSIYLDAPIDTYEVRNHQVGIVVSQSLYSATNLANFNKAQQGELAADLQLRAVEQNLLVRVAQAYFNVLAAQDAYSSIQASKRAAEQQLKAAERSFEVGNTTVIDIREARAQLDNILAQEIASENNLQTTELALAQVTGLDNPKPYRLADASMPVLPKGDMLSWVNTAQNNSTSIALARIALVNAGYDLDAAEGGHHPTLDLEFDYSANNTSAPKTLSNASSHKPTSEITLRFNLPLFTGYAVTNGIDAALAKKIQARANLDKAIRETIGQVKSAYLNLQSGISQVRALEAALVSGESALEANQLGYELGVRMNIDVLNAQSNVFKTQAELARARYILLVNGLQLRQVAGTLSMDDLTELNKLFAAP